jgi:hypothetical protein
VAWRLDHLDGVGVGGLDEIDAQVQRWYGEVRSLGAVPRGLWLVEFPSLAGWFGWQQGDDDVTLFRLYGTAPGERSRLH